MLIVTSLLFFLLAGATLSLLLWTGMRAFPRRRKTRWATGWRSCSRRPWWWRRAPRGAKIGGGVWTGSCTWSSVVPGGEDWMNGTEKLLAQAGIRRKSALALYCILQCCCSCSLLAAGTVYLQRDNPNGPGSLIGGLAAAFLLGFICCPSRCCTGW